ncbi:hypothetical protein WJX74_005598 [Apatococcus lobatus]|uniref:Transcription elongation factor Eaf N-terminal domain-containing protein n=1 Tax=Apatococcus lobatus TaxID=904363 RepID=A0AAW1QAV2_9CHLO
MAALLGPQLDTAYELRLGNSILGKRKADEALYALKTQFKPQSAGTFKAGTLQLDHQKNQACMMLPNTATNQVDLEFQGPFEPSRDGLDAVAIFDGTCWRLELIDATLNLRCTQRANPGAARAREAERRAPSPAPELRNQSAGRSAQPAAMGPGRQVQTTASAQLPDMPAAAPLQAPKPSTAPSDQQASPARPAPTHPPKSLKAPASHPQLKQPPTPLTKPGPTHPSKSQLKVPAGNPQPKQPSTHSTPPAPTHPSNLHPKPPTGHPRPKPPPTHPLQPTAIHPSKSHQQAPITKGQHKAPLPNSVQSQQQAPTRLPPASLHPKHPTPAGVQAPLVPSAAAQQGGSAAAAKPTLDIPPAAAPQPTAVSASEFSERGENVALLEPSLATQSPVEPLTAARGFGNQVPAAVAAAAAATPAASQPQPSGKPLTSLLGSSMAQEKPQEQAPSPSGPQKAAETPSKPISGQKPANRTPTLTHTVPIGQQPPAKVAAMGSPGSSSSSSDSGSSSSSSDDSDTESDSPAAPSASEPQQIPADQTADFEDEFFGGAPPPTAAPKPVVASGGDDDSNNSSDEDDQNRCSEDEEKDEFEDL